MNNYNTYLCLTFSSFGNNINSLLSLGSLLSNISKVLKLATLCNSSDYLFASERCQLFQCQVDYRRLHVHDIKSTDNDVILLNHKYHFTPPYQLFLGGCSVPGCKCTAGFPTTPARFWWTHYIDGNNNHLLWVFLMLEALQNVCYIE